MNEPKVQDLDYINLLLATPRVVSASEGARVQPEEPRRAAHDAFTRLLQRLEPDSTPLWREAEALVERRRGLMIIDDSTLDKPYSYQIALVHRHGSGKHRRVVAGINLVSLVGSAGPHALPCDYRLFDAPHDGHTKTIICERCCTWPSNAGSLPSTFASTAGIAASRTSNCCVVLAGTG